ncbi:MAG: hypothetical protein IJ062_11965 [Firmicutes bacterium]|nr:hypothetical protein [Bacillota bacterium]
MKKAIVVALIGLIGTVTAAAIGYDTGKSNQIEAIQSQIANVTGNENNVIINDVNDFVTRYNELVKSNEDLEAKNTQYFSDYQKVTNEKEQLESMFNDSPSVKTQDMGLYINGENININKSNSFAMVNGTEYFSKEILEKVIDKNKELIVQDDNVFIGRVVSDSTKLFSQRIVDSNNYEVVENATDSYGNPHSNVARLNNETKVIYSLNENYSLLRFKLAIDEKSYGDRKCMVSISIDGNPIKSFSNLDKVSTKELEIDSMGINNCSILEISCTGDRQVYPLIYDAVVYN